MEFKNRVIFNGVGELRTFADRELPMKLAYAVAKTLRPLGDAFEDIVELRNKVINRYAVRDDDGNTVPNKSGGVVFTDGKEVDRQLEELFSQTTEVAVHAISMQDFGDKFQPTSAEVAALLRFGILKDEDE